MICICFFLRVPRGVQRLRVASGKNESMYSGSRGRESGKVVTAVVIHGSRESCKAGGGSVDLVPGSY